MASIGTTIFNDEGARNFLVLNNRDQYSRQLYIPPTGWSTLNIGVLYSIDATGSLPQGTGLWLGMTTSTQPGVGMKQASYSNFTAIQRMFGVGMGGGIGYLGTYSPTVWFYRSSSADISGSVVDGQVGYHYAISGSPGYQTNSGGNYTSVFVPTTQDTPRKVTLVCSLRKASGVSYVVSPLWVSTYTGSDGTNHNHTMDTMLSIINSPVATNSTRTIDNVQQYIPGGSSLPVQATDDANYPLDTVNIYWTGSVPCRIYGIGVAIAR